MKVDRAKALHADIGGKRFYFCSEHCLHAFEAEPDRHQRDSVEASQAAHAG